MHGLLYYPFANLFKYLFSFPVSRCDLFANWVPVLCFPLNISVVTPFKRRIMRLQWFPVRP